LPVEKLNDCDPIKLNKDISPSLKAFWKNVTLKPEDPAIPCGLVAKSVFTDSYTVYLNNEEQKINSTGISWESDRLWKFKNIIDDDVNKWKSI